VASVVKKTRWVLKEEHCRFGEEEWARKAR